MNNNFNFTPYPEVNSILNILLSNFKQILKDQFIGMYLYGSLALGDFDPGKSDIDFLVVTKDELTESNRFSREILEELNMMHLKIAALNSKWANELEGSYISKGAIRKYNPLNSTHPHIDRGDGLLKIEKHDTDWVIQRYVLREYGVVLDGPTPRTLIDPITSEALRLAIKGFLWWWELQLSDTSRVQRSDYQAYSVLTMCRILYTYEHGTIVSKPAAARWAQDAIDSKWANLIKQALNWQHGMQLSRLDDALDFIRYTLGECKKVGGQVQ